MTEPKKKRGSWKPGQSGNPAGRPPGLGEVGRFRAAIGDRVPELLAAMMTRALEGDVGAARLLLERSHRAAEGRRATTSPFPARGHPDGAGPRRAGVGGQLVSLRRDPGCRAAGRDRHTWPASPRLTNLQSGLRKLENKYAKP
jgi:hypothetical protein